MKLSPRGMNCEANDLTTICQSLREKQNDTKNYSIFLKMTPINFKSSI